MALRKTPARDLDKFIEEHLLPDTDFSRRVRAAVGTLCAFLKERCFRNASHPVRVSKVVKGGSSGKGTALRGRSDADLVVFLNNLTSFDEQFNRRAEFLEEIKKQLEACQREQQFRVTFKVQSSWWFWWFTPRALSFTLSDPYLQQEVEFDVLLAYDALGHSSKYSKPEPHIYARLIHECTNLKREGEFSTCFTELQRSFLKQRPPKLKSLIRLVKHWYQLCKEKLGNPLPPQYALELLTVHAWERGCGEIYFSTAEGFKTVLQLVMEYQKLCVYWTVYYDFNDQFISDYLYRQLQKTRPVILDPADPTGNVASENLDGWQRLAGEAEAWLQYPCFKNWDGSPVGFWNVPMEVKLPPVQDGFFHGFRFFLVFLLLVVLFGISNSFLPLLILLLFVWLKNSKIFLSILTFLVNCLVSGCYCLCLCLCLGFWGCLLFGFLKQGAVSR